MKILTKEEEAAHYKYVSRDMIQTVRDADGDIVPQSRAELSVVLLALRSLVQPWPEQVDDTPTSEPSLFLSEPSS